MFLRKSDETTGDLQAIASSTAHPGVDSKGDPKVGFLTEGWSGSAWNPPMNQWMDSGTVGDRLPFGRCQETCGSQQPRYPVVWFTNPFPHFLLGVSGPNQELAPVHRQRNQDTGPPEEVRFQGAKSRDARCVELKLEWRLDLFDLRIEEKQVSYNSVYECSSVEPCKFVVLDVESEPNSALGGKRQAMASEERAGIGHGLPSGKGFFKTRSI